MKNSSENMKIPTTFLPERKNLEEKVESLAQESYSIKPAIEEKIDTQELYQFQELKSRRNKWSKGDHLTSFYRLGVNTLAIFSAVAVSTCFGIELNDYLKDNLPRSYYNIALPSAVITWMFGSILLAYRSMAEFFMRYDLWQYNKKMNKP